jgi:hypothetical protein
MQRVFSKTADFPGDRARSLPENRQKPAKLGF